MSATRRASDQTDARMGMRPTPEEMHESFSVCFSHRVKTMLSENAIDLWRRRCICRTRRGEVFPMMILSYWRKEEEEKDKLGINFTKLDESVGDLKRQHGHAACYSGAEINGADTRMFLPADCPLLFRGCSGTVVGRSRDKKQQQQEGLHRKCDAEGIRETSFCCKVTCNFAKFSTRELWRCKLCRLTFKMYGRRGLIGSFSECFWIFVGRTNRPKSLF